MNIKFLGTGGPFDHQLVNSSAIVEIADRKILVDCGHSVFPKIKDLDLAGTIDYLLITHTHDDHVGSLASLILYAYHQENKRFTLLYPTEEFLDHLRQYLSFSLEEPDELIHYEHISHFPGLDYIDTTGHHVSYLHTFAYVFEDGEERIVYSGDTARPDHIFGELQKMPPKSSRVFHDLTFEKDSSHTFYKDLEAYCTNFDIYGYHSSSDMEPFDNKVPLVENMPELLLQE